MSDIFSYFFGTKTNDVNPKTQYSGIAVASSTGSLVADEDMKDNIRSYFSDEVVIHPDENGSGIVKPVFKNRNGNDFVYVLVPVKEKKQ